MAVEMFLIPGFGVFGILGLGSMGLGFLMLAAGATIGDGGNALTQEGVVSFGLQFVVTTILGFVTLFALSRFFPKIGPARRMVLEGPTPASVDTPPEAGEALPPLGAEGVATSDLRPGGSAMFADVPVSVVSVQGYLPRGAGVRVVQVEGSEVRVEETPA